MALSRLAAVTNGDIKATSALKINVDAGVRHLLRNLDNPAALRTNPLVAHLFDPVANSKADRLAIAQIRRKIEGIAKQLECEAAAYPRRSEILRRQQTILEECDLGGRSHKVVARQLGLERRQFYRERRMVRRRVAESIELFDVSAPAVLCIDPIAADLVHLRSLRNAGQDDEAIRVAGDVLRHIDDALRRIEVSNTLIEIYSERGDAQQAENLATQCALFASGKNLEAKLMAAWGSAYAEMMRGSHRTAAEAFRSIADSLGSVRHSSADTLDELLARAYLGLAECEHMQGDHQAALSAWHSAHQMLSESSTLAAATKAQILWHTGAGLFMSGGSDGEAAEYFEQSMSLAIAHALPRECADVLIAFANLYRRRQDFERALERARNAVRISGRVFGENARAWRSLNAACIELAAGNVDEALGLARGARAAKGSNPMRDGYGKWIESSALLAAGDVSAALPIARESVEDLRQAQNPRHLGASLRVYAEIAFRAQLKNEALEAIDQAVDLLTKYGLPIARANALQSRVAILNS